MAQETKTKSQDARDKQEVLNDVIAVMDTHAGRRYIWRLLERAGIFRSPYSSETNDAYFRMGGHNFGLEVFTELLDASPDLFLVMQKEHYILELPDKPAKEDSDA